MTTPHDAEEALRPYLGRVYDAADEAGRYEGGNLTVFLGIEGREILALNQALDKALELLGVQR